MGAGRAVRRIHQSRARLFFPSLLIHLTIRGADGISPPMVRIARNRLCARRSRSRVSRPVSVDAYAPIFKNWRQHTGIGFRCAAWYACGPRPTGMVEFAGVRGGYGNANRSASQQRHHHALWPLKDSPLVCAKGTRGIARARPSASSALPGMPPARHLHYEFKLAGIHQDPMRVALPKAEPLDAKYLPSSCCAVAGVSNWRCCEMRSSAGLISTPPLACRHHVRHSMDGADAIVADFLHARAACTRLASEFPSAAEGRIAGAQCQRQRRNCAGIALLTALADTYRARSTPRSNCSADRGCIADSSRLSRPDGTPPARSGYTVKSTTPHVWLKSPALPSCRDFRSRDIAAGGQVPAGTFAFHDGIFRSPHETRVIVNIGGIANITFLAPGIPAWALIAGLAIASWTRLLGAALWGKPLTQWRFAAQGRVAGSLFARLSAHHISRRRRPKHGRDDFHTNWLAAQLNGESAADVQATLFELTAWAISVGSRHAPRASRGNAVRRRCVQQYVAARPWPKTPGISVELVSQHGVPEQQVEARSVRPGSPSNAWSVKALISRTPGAAGPRIRGRSRPAVEIRRPDEMAFCGAASSRCSASGRSCQRQMMLIWARKENWRWRGI